ncbi:hypothetical protein TeGR_g912 [Tetraparma gracilis]|uniref:Uncharacterized protein n=1 Tax=Tetraparma gracilis TaxID=2962635 RepID=A0ABQ6MWE8_9STRA|nr:hypothetical protein TeGR_g912 [Tetraparma gracilis]
MHLLSARRTGPEAFLLSFENVTSRRAAEQLKGATLHVCAPPPAAKPPEDGAYPVSALSGLPVFLLAVPAERLGEVSALVLAADYNPLAKDLLEVRLPPPSPGSRPRYALLPLVAQIVPLIVTEGEGGREDGLPPGVYITPPGGLLELAVEKEEKVVIRGLLRAADD